MGKGTRLGMWLSLTLLGASFTPFAHAEVLTVSGDTVTLATLVPALSGTELGGIELGPAPLPGQRRTIRSSDVKRALRERGRSYEGLRIPARVTVTRPLRRVSRQEVEARVRESISESVAPCELGQLSLLPGWSIADADYEVSARVPAAVTSGRRSLVVVVKQGERKQRISAQVELSCPPPVIAPGASVRLIARSGAVRVSAPAKALQAGRVGDEIRVTNQLSRATVTALVIDAQTVEVQL